MMKKTTPNSKPKTTKRTNSTLAPKAKAKKTVAKTTRSQSYQKDEEINLDNTENDVILDLKVKKLKRKKIKNQIISFKSKINILKKEYKELSKDIEFFQKKMKKKLKK